MSEEIEITAYEGLPSHADRSPFTIVDPATVPIEVIPQEEYNNSEAGMTNMQRETVIAAALESEEGRLALAQAMVEPIRTSLDYQAIGRRLLHVDELPQGAMARYERDVASVNYVVNRRGEVPDRADENEEILMPTFEIGALPMIRLSEIRARRFYIVDDVRRAAEQAIQNAEDREILQDLAPNEPMPTEFEYACRQGQFELVRSLYDKASQEGENAGAFMLDYILIHRNMDLLDFAKEKGIIPDVNHMRRAITMENKDLLIKLYAMGAKVEELEKDDLVSITKMFLGGVNLDTLLPNTADMSDERAISFTEE